MQDEYRKTMEIYNRNVSHFEEKLASFDWGKQIDRFVSGLKGRKILDAGCGTGRDVGEFIKRGLLAEGLDYSAENIRLSRRKYPGVVFHEGDLMKMNLPDNGYDGLWCCASLLHIKKQDAPGVLNEFRRVLKPGGKLFISVKEGAGEKMVSDEAGERFFSFYRAGELKGKVSEAGFRVYFTEKIPHASILAKAQPTQKKPGWVCVFAEKP